MVEVLAAMVIFSAGAAVLFTWIGQTSDRLGRLSAEQRDLFGELVALEYMKTVNPMLNPEGEVQLADGTRLRWTSRRSHGSDTIRRPGSLYEVGLYDVQVTVGRREQGEQQSKLLLAGWRQERQKSTQSPISGGG